MRQTVYLTVVLVIGSSGLMYGQDADAKGSLQKKLSSQFPLTQISSDRSAVVSEGAVILLQKPGLMMYGTASPMPPLNTYKNGKISQGGGGFGRDFAISMATPGNGTSAKYPQRRLAAGVKLFVTGLTVQKTEIDFRLYESYRGFTYYGELKFPFEKNSVPTPEQALATIAEVLTVQPATAAPAGEPPPQPQSAATELKLPATYVNSQADQLQLNADHSFSLQEAGQPHSGTFAINGAMLEIKIDGNPATMTMEGNNLKDSSQQIWVRQEQAAKPAPSGGVLLNQDIIKLAKAGIDDPIIIAKISSSKCQFDTSSDALIQLKTSGVSSAVLSAMIAAGK